MLVFFVRQIWDDGRTGRMEDGKPDRTEGRLCERKWIGDGYGMITRCSRDALEMLSRCSREGDCKTLKMNGIRKQQNERQNLERKRIEKITPSELILPGIA